VLIDLRNNGGGSRQAVDLPVCSSTAGRCNSATQRPDLRGSGLAGLAWDGPLAVLINRSSASASEICAAIQDYGGASSSVTDFGKGTVHVIDPIKSPKTSRNSVKC
jgi:carboxyl-terminal processing protease